MKLHELKEGDPVVMVDSNPKKSPRRGVIAKVGRKYFTVGVFLQGFSSYSIYGQFNKETGRKKDDSNYHIETPEEYEDNEKASVVWGKLNAKGVQLARSIPSHKVLEIAKLLTPILGEV